MFEVEDIHLMLCNWGVWQRMPAHDGIPCFSSPTFHAMKAAQGHIMQDANCKAVYHEPTKPDYVLLIEDALQAMHRDKKLQPVVGTKLVKSTTDEVIETYTKARLWSSVLTRFYVYREPQYRTARKHLTPIKYANSGKIAKSESVQTIIDKSIQWICDFLNGRAKIS